MIISFLNDKGGVGKTTLAIHFADYLSRQGKKVLLVDANETPSTLNWSEKSNTCRLKVIGMDKPILHKELPKFSEDYIIVDGAAHISKMTSSTIVCSDVVICPLNASSLDLDSTQPVIQTVANYKEIHRAPCLYYVLNQFDPRTNIAKKIAEKIIEEDVAPLLDTKIKSKVIYKESLAEGKTIYDYPHAAVDQDVMTTLIKEVLIKSRGFK